MFEFSIITLSFIAGLIASVAGFGIGSLLIPLVSIRTGTKTAVALVSLPHFLGTGLRFWLLRAKVDRKIFAQFGVLCAAGGLTGAFLNTYFENDLLRVIFSVMLIIAGILGVLQVSERVRLGKAGAGVLGFASGFFGGLVGEQGGIRSAALLGFNVKKEAFIATATATGLIVDLVRMPVYAFFQSNQFVQFAYLLVLTSVPVLVGTLVGNVALKRIPEKNFKRIVSVGILLLGIYLLLIG